jgi:hypothetical protein
MPAIRFMQPAASEWILNQKSCGHVPRSEPRVGYRLRTPA